MSCEMCGAVKRDKAGHRENMVMEGVGCEVGYGGDKSVEKLHFTLQTRRCLVQSVKDHTK